MPNDFLTTTLDLLARTAVIWAPFVLFAVAWKKWVKFIHLEYVLTKIKWVLLEVRVPKEVNKSPLAMELVLANAFYQTGGTGTWFARWWLGKVRNFFSLEIVSIEGRISFLIRAPEMFRKLIESQIYAQYPQAQISDAVDYTQMVPAYKKDNGWKIWGCEFVLTQHDAYPIKSYVDYGLDKAIGTLEEEQRIDPITSMLEFMGSLHKDEQVWFQIVIRAATDRFDDPKKWLKKRGWKDESRDVINDLLKKYKGEKDKPAEKLMTKGMEENIKSMERHLNKLGFDCGIRAIYLAKNDVFDAAHIQGLLSSVKQYNSNELNGFKPFGDSVTDFDYPWQNFLGSLEEKKAELFNSYKLRSFFTPPYSRKPFVLSTEELATIYHFPGRVSETPSFARIESKTAEPPTNLPI